MSKASEWHVVKEADRERILCHGIFAGDTCGESAVVCEHTEGGSFFYYCADHAHKRGFRRFACPKCQDTRHLDVAVVVFARIKQYGPEDVQTDADESMDGSHEWDGDSMMHCIACGHSDKCSTFDREWEPAALPFSCPKCGKRHNTTDFEDESDEDCTCSDRSWYGKEHDSACVYAGQPRTGEQRPTVYNYCSEACRESH